MLSAAALKTSKLVMDNISLIPDIEPILDERLYRVFRDQYSALTEHRNIRDSSGVYRTALIFNTCVVKTVQCRVEELTEESEYEIFNAFLKEYNFINRMRQTPFARHFPAVKLLKTTLGNYSVWFQLQEKISMIESKKMRHLQYDVEDFAEKLGISDMHDANYGWKFDDNGDPYPVFIDCEANYACELPKPRKVLDWMIY